MIRSTRQRKTSNYFLQRNFAIGCDEASDSEEISDFSVEEEEEEENERKSPLPTNNKRKSEEITESEPKTKAKSSPRKRTKISLTKSTTLSGSIEFIDTSGIKKTESFNFRTNSDKGYHFETNQFSVNNFAVGNYIYFFIKRTPTKVYDFMFKITPHEHKIEFLDKNCILYPPFNEDFKEDFTKKYIKKNDVLYTDFSAVFSSRGENHLELVFKDGKTDLTFCTFNIESKE